MDEALSEPIIGKLNRLRDTLDEIEGWVGSGRPDARGADVATLLQSVLARRSVSVENIPLYLEAERPPGLHSERVA